MSTASKPRPGLVLDDKWRIAGLLGEGGMGAVYAAAHARNGLSVAIKILSSAMAKDESITKRFLSEGYLANRVGHAGSVRVLDDGTTPDGLPYWVMERLTGATLETLAQAEGGRLPINDVLRYAIAVADVLAAAHKQGIVHRDIKPENIFLCDDGVVKVLDFGIASVRDFSQQVRLTVTGVPLGTPAFMPPEQAMAHWHRVGPSSDVYALGATIFNLITGRLAHEGSTVPELLVRVSTQQARPIRSIHPDVPESLAKIIDCALSFAPEDRYESAASMLAALRSIAAGGPLTTLPSIVGPLPVSIGHMPPVEFKSGSIRETSVPVSSSSHKSPLGPARTALVITLFALLGVGGGAASFVAISRRDNPEPPSSTPAKDLATPRPETTEIPSATSSSEPRVTPEPSAVTPSVPAPIVSVTPSAPVAVPSGSPISVASASTKPAVKPVSSSSKPSAGKGPTTPEVPDPMGFH